MSFDYDKLSAKEGEHTSWWTSYADLFMMLSIVFLLMYVASALRSGSNGFQQQMEYKKLSQKAEGLEQQIKVYNTLKDESLKKEASQSEQEVYTKLMSKLTLLQDEAHDEKNALRAKAKENEEKEFALNQYQQLIRNIINANILAKTQIQHRDQLIISKDATIEEKKAKIVEMEKIVALDEAQITKINDQLDNRIKQLKAEQHAHKISKIILEKRISALREDSETKIAAIEEKKQAITAQLGEVRGTLEHTEAKLEHTEVKLGEATVAVQQKQQENAALAAKLDADRKQYIAEMADLKAKHDANLAAERQAFMDNLQKQRLTAAARAKKLAEFAAQAEAKAGDLEGKLTGLRGKIAETEGKLKGTELEAENAKKRLAGTQQALVGTQQALLGTEAKLAGTQQALSGTKQALAGTEAKLVGTQQALVGTQQALSGTKQALAGTQSKLAGTEAEKERALASVEDLKGDLARTRAIANARKQLAQRISDQFAKSGIKGAVDGRTGEVTLDFGGEYFETGSTTLKPKMRMTLDKFIPIYARSIFNDPKLADKIANVEVVGFASSTYQGRYVNPKSVRPEDKKAIEYNLKLSFGRANSIFSHVLNHGNLSKEERERLLPLMKVVGRGYLPEGKNASELPDAMTEKEFCAKYSCQKAQKVTVKFNMKD